MENKRLKQHQRPEDFSRMKQVDRSDQASRLSADAEISTKRGKPYDDGYSNNIKNVINSMLPVPPQQDDQKSSQFLRGKRNMRSLYYNTNEDNIDSFEEDSQQSRPNLPKNAKIATGNGQYQLLKNLEQINMEKKRSSRQEEQDLNYNGPPLEPGGKKFSGTQKLGNQNSYEFRIGSRVVQEVSSDNRLITSQEQVREDFRRKSVVSPDIQNPKAPGHPYRVIKQNQVNFSKGSQKSLNQNNEYREPKVQNSLERQLIEIQRGKNSSNSAMSHIGNNGEKKSIYQQNIPFCPPRNQIASSQLTTYNRIANIGKLNKIQKATPQVSKPQPNSQQPKGKFYQTQVLKNNQGPKQGDQVSNHLHNQDQQQVYCPTNNSSQISITQKSFIQPSTQEQSTTQLLDGSALFQQVQKIRTNSLEKIQANLNLSNQKQQYSVQKKNIIYRPPSTVKQYGTSQEDTNTNKNQLRLKLMPKNNTIEKNELERRPQANSQLSHLSQNSGKNTIGDKPATSSSYQQDILIFPPRMIKQPRNEMNASAPLNLQLMKVAPQPDETIGNSTIDAAQEKGKRPLSNKMKKKLPTKLNKQLLGSIIVNESRNKSQVMQPKQQQAINNLNNIKKRYMGSKDQNSSFENLEKKEESGQKIQARQRPLSSTGRMKNNLKNLKSDKKGEFDTQEESEEDEKQLELLNQLQQLNCLDQAQLNKHQLTQFQELLKIKEDIQNNIAMKNSFGSTMTTSNLKMMGNIQPAGGKKKSTKPRVAEKVDMSSLTMPIKKSKTALNSYVTTFGNTMVMAEALKVVQGDTLKRKSLSKQKLNQQTHASQKEINNRGVDTDFFINLNIKQDVESQNSVGKNYDYEDQKKTIKKPVKTSKSQVNNTMSSSNPTKKQKLAQTDQFKNLKNINDYAHLLQLQMMQKLSENDYRSKSQQKNLNLTQPLSKLLSKRQPSVAKDAHDEYQNFTDQIIEGESEEYFRLTGILNSSQQDNFNLSQLLKEKRMSGQQSRPQSIVDQQISKQVSKNNIAQRKRSNSRQGEKKIPPQPPVKKERFQNQKRLSINSQSSTGMPQKPVVGNPNAGSIAIATGATPADKNPTQLSTKKYKISKTTKNQTINNNFVKQPKQQTQQQILSLLNFYNKNNQKQIPTKTSTKPAVGQQKKLMTQKLQMKQTQLVNDIYLKVMKSSIMGTSSIASNPGSQKQKKGAKKFQQNSQEEIHYFGGSVEVEECEQVAKQHPFSLENTSGPQHLRENLRNAANLGSTQVPRLQIPSNFDFNNYNQVNTNNKPSLMGTIKGGLGIMQNLSSEFQNDSSIEMNPGKILNIENVLKNKQIFPEIQQQSDEEEDEVPNETQQEENSGNKTQPLPPMRAVAQCPESSQLKKKSNCKEPESDKKVSQLDLKDGSRIPCADTFIPQKEKPENKKRVEYMNKLKEELDDKIKQRYTNLQQKNTMSQSNNLILIDHNSAYNPSQMGDEGDGNSQVENRVHNYMFGRQIGEGAYAVVRIATSRDNNQKYAIKVYDKTKLRDINRQRSVRREVVLLQKMNHPNIVKLIEAFETDSHVYLVMENVSGGSLHSYLKQMINKQLDEEEARRIINQILVALKYCHSKCIAHRDIKLENILLDEHKNVKLIDFGFSTCIPNHKKLRMFCGTPSYMAPQIVSKVEYAGPPADIWATGVLMYALLNGCFPFRGSTDDDLYRRIKRGTYHIYNQKVTREYIDILQRCLDVNDDTRPNANDLLEDQWFKLTDIKQRAYEEEKKQFKARILAKVPLIQKTNHTICILAQNPNEIPKKNEKSKEDEKSDKSKKQIHILNDQKPNFPYANKQDDLVISDYGLHSGIGLEKDKEKEKNQQHIGPRENYPMTINLNNQLGSSNLPTNMLNQIAPIVPTAHGGAILLSYGAAMAPQIQINNINNLHLINTNMKKKLNHEAYQAYYNTSSANNCINIGPSQGLNQSSPIANQEKQQPKVITNVYGQSQPIMLPYEVNTSTQSIGANSSSQGNLLSGNNPRQIELYQQNQSDPSPVQQFVNVPSSQYNLSGSENPPNQQIMSSHGQTVLSNENLIHIDEGNVQLQQYNLTNVSGSQQTQKSRAVSIQYSPYSSAYNNQIVNNQMAQLYQLQQEQLREQQLKQSDGDQDAEFCDNLEESDTSNQLKVQLNISTPGN